MSTTNSNARERVANSVAAELSGITFDGLLGELTRRGISLKAQAGQITVNAPKGSLDEALRNQIAHYKSEFLARLSGGAKVESEVVVPSITPHPEAWFEPFPFSDLQVGFYLGGSESMEYHVRPHYYLEIDYEVLDVERYTAAWNRALAHHQASLPLVTADLNLQVPRAPAPIRIAVSDLRHRSQDEVDAEIRRVRGRMERAELPLDRWPWFDWHITRYGTTGARVHFNSNNFFSDGYGTQQLLALVDRLYAQPDLQLPPLDLSFRDCVLALQRLEESSLGQKSLAYWRSRIPHLPAPPPLPQVTGMDPCSRSHLVRRSRLLDAGIWSDFKAAAGRHGLTPTSAIYAVYAEVMARWSGSRHFLLNNMVTHRFPMHPRIKEVIGNFASLYPLEVDWRGEMPFAQRAQRLQEQLFRDLDHVYCSSMRVLQELNQAQGTPGRAPCPHVIGSGLFMESWEEHAYSCLETSQTQLDHQFWELDDGRYLAVWDLLEEFFPAGFIDAMWQAYLELIERLAETPAVWSQPYPAVIPAAQQAVRDGLLETDDLETDHTLDWLLARAAALRPDHPAVIAPQRVIDYATLQRHACVIAGCLQREGVRPGALVAVVMHKGWEQVVAVSGILAAGAAYVPVDPEVPRDRLHHILADAEAQAVLTQPSLDPLLEWPDGLPRLVVDDNLLAAHRPMAAVTGRGPDELAYLIYTSGSTGVPKGVMITHRGALNTVRDINRRYGITAEDRLFGISSLSFDLSVYDLFGAFAAGATLVLPAAEALRDPGHWLESMQRNAVTLWNSAPALMQLLTDAATPGTRLPALRTVMLSGDWIPVTLPGRIRSLAPETRVFSLGGATEAAIWSIHYPIGQVDPAWQSIPYGTPLTNQCWHVLDADGNACPDWVTGELYIGGAGVAPGYWRDAQKTEHSFVVVPRLDARLYRTGDLGRYLPDGNIEFLGRRDFQVKVQGHRIELGEIEAALLRHPQVEAAVASVQQVGADGRALVAHVVTRRPGAVAMSELREQLAAWLPQYMVPVMISELTGLPLTANGKVDRKALPHHAGGVGAGTTARVAPRDAVERALAALWCELLGLEEIGIGDDFFALGGQSFTAIRMLARVAERFGRHVPLAELLHGRTIEHVAGLLREAAPATSWSPLVKLSEGPGTPWFLVHPAGGSVLAYRELAQRLSSPLYALQARGLMGDDAPLDEVAGMADSYLAAIEGVQPTGAVTLGGWSSGGPIAFEMARQLEARGRDVARVVLVDAPAPLQHEPVDLFTLLAWFLEDLHMDLPLARLDPQALRAVPRSALLAGALQQVAVGGPPLDATDLTPVWAVFQATIRAVRHYHAQPINAPLVVLRAADQVVSEFNDHPAVDVDDWGWQPFARGGVVCHRIAGTHHTMLQPPGIQQMVDVLEQYLG